MTHQALSDVEATFLREQQLREGLEMIERWHQQAREITERNDKANAAADFIERRK